MQGMDLCPWRFLVTSSFLLTPKLVLIYRNKQCTSYTIPVEIAFSTPSGCMPEKLLHTGKALIAPEESFLITHLKEKLLQTALLK